MAAEGVATEGAATEGAARAPQRESATTIARRHGRGVIMRVKISGRGRGAQDRHPDGGESGVRSRPIHRMIAPRRPAPRPAAWHATTSRADGRIGPAPDRWGRRWIGLLAGGGWSGSRRYATGTFATAPGGRARWATAGPEAAVPVRHRGGTTRTTTDDLRKI
ncbi:hypothetical protein GCM10012280_44120 [Wenjunlia tyrosinilytica]|uniref:Uncharacterized protein n=1 Tax=Wenjunlia tyrosinilytica TaxID=1544741 RepID=A0A918E0G2_9ACTN|nr:hypothetical protein GCM10012280_44120 [Wenjunlia tyrosinilytica]